MTTLSIEALIEASLKAETVEDIHELPQVTHAQIEYFIYGAQLQMSFIRPEYVIISGFPEDWWERYNAKGYMQIDQIVAHCATRVVPPWDRIDPQRGVARVTPK